MSEAPISISNLNDFIFCPVSIYFHSLEDDEESILLQDSPQLNGTAAHEKSDTATYSTKKSMLQGVSVYSEELNIVGKIDTYDIEAGILTERKKKIKTIYDGYIYQLYGQYFSLKEMGFDVRKIRLYSMDDNKMYPIDLPELNQVMYRKFLQTLHEIENFEFDSFQQGNALKCQRCIYEPLCSFSALKGGEI